MKANEVRLNNYVIYDNEVYQIDTIAEVFPTLNTDKFGIGVVDWNNIKPIPLTEEWLIKFGFEVYEFDHKENQYRINDRLLVVRNNVFYDYGSRVELKYVHQLQNLFFALTQKELTL